MRFVLAPDSFKESMTAPAAAAAMARGVRAVFADAECELVPMADGGEGTTQALLAALGGELVQVRARDGLGRPIDATYGYVSQEHLAVIEVATAAGIDLVAPRERNPLLASSAGVGDVLRHALDRGARRFVVGLGGTVTNDGGAGMLAALGARLLDADGDELPPGGAALGRLHRLDLTHLDPRIGQIEVEIASDVTNPLLGERGASAVFGPQKGATPQMVQVLDAALAVFAAEVTARTGTAVADLPGAGAAGGLGAAFLAFFPARMRSGVDVVAQAARLPQRVARADFVFTGEGSVDSQTLAGKTPYGVAQVAAAAGVPVVVFAGRVGPGAEELHHHGVSAVVPILRGVTDLPAALAEGERNLELAAATVCRILAAAGR